MVGYVIDGKTWLHDLWGIAVKYLSDTPFERLDERHTTECIIEMRCFTWSLLSYIVMLLYLELVIDVV